LIAMFWVGSPWNLVGDQRFGGRYRFIFTLEAVGWKNERCRRYVSPKCWQPPTRLKYVTNQRTEIDRNTGKLHNRKLILLSTKTVKSKYI
jgi:hypothetical protein